MIAAALAAALLAAAPSPGPLAAAARGPFPREERGLLSHSRESRPDKTILQGVGGSAAGVLTGGAFLVVGIGLALCEYDCGNESTAWTMILAAPVAHSFTQALVAHRIGRAYDKGDSGTFKGTLAGSALGTAAGVATWMATDQSKGGFVAALGLSMAGTIAGYELSRPHERRAGMLEVGREGLQAGIPVPQPYVSRAPDGRTSAGLTLPVLSLGF